MISLFFSNIYLRTFNANLLDSHAELHKIPKKKNIYISSKYVQVNPHGTVAIFKQTNKSIS